MPLALRHFALSAVLAFGCAIASLSAAAGDRLKGLNEVRVVIAPPTDAALECGLDEAQLRAAALGPIMAGTNLREIDSSSAPMLFVTAVTRKSGDTCGHSVLVQLKYPALHDLPWQSEAAATVLLWQWGKLLLGPSAESRRSVAAAVEEAALSLVKQWQSANNGATAAP